MNESPEKNDLKTAILALAAGSESGFTEKDAELVRDWLVETYTRRDLLNLIRRKMIAISIKNGELIFSIIGEKRK